MSTAATMREAKQVFRQALTLAESNAGQRVTPIAKSRLAIVHVPPSYARPGQIDIVKEVCADVETILLRVIYIDPAQPMIHTFRPSAWLIAFRRAAKPKSDVNDRFEEGTT
jgi:hypothetical protein